jgi:hypothetical protein
MNYKLLGCMSGLALLTLSGCAFHMSKQQCLTTNWYQRGFNAGSNGQRANVASDIVDCQKFHINVNSNAYERGWNAGIKRFCTYRRGYQLGSQGQANPNICPAGQLQQHFNRGFHKGANVFCRNPSNGFALGRQGSGFPPACSSARFLAFNTSYQQGQAIHQRVSDVKNRISDINSRIDTLVSNYDFRQRADGFYKLGHRRQDAKAQYRLRQVNRMVRERNRLQSQSFRAEIAD